MKKLFSTTLLSLAIIAGSLNLETANAATAAEYQALVAEASVKFDAAKGVLASKQNDTQVAFDNLATAKSNYQAALAKQKTAATAKTNANTAFMTARSNIIKSKGFRNISALISAFNNMKAADDQSSAATNEVSSSNAAVTEATKQVDEKTIAMRDAQKSYDLALASLTDNQAFLAEPGFRPITIATTKGRVQAPTGQVLDTTKNKKSIIDIMVYYTTESMTAEYAKQRIQYLTAITNQAYRDSGINVELRLVYTEKTTYTENNNNRQALSDLSMRRSAFIDTDKKRELYGADIVLLLRPLRKNNVGTGFAQLCDFRFENMNKNCAYGVIGDGVSPDLDQNGNVTAVSSINTFAHEVGHILGLLHERMNAGTDRGAYSYSYSWSSGSKFGTIMSYSGQPIMLFSTPALATQCAGEPCGYPESDKERQSDQARSVNNVAPLVEAYMPTKIITPVFN